MARLVLAASAPGVSRHFTVALGQAGHVVAVCSDVNSALEELSGVRESDLLLVHILLEGGGAEALCGKVARLSRLRSLPTVLIVDAWPELGAPGTLLPGDLDDMLLSSSSADEIRGRVDLNLRSKRLAAETRRHNSELEIKVVEHTRKVAALADEVRSERDVLREAVNLIEDGVLLLDNDGVVVLENTAGRRMRDPRDVAAEIVDPDLAALASQARHSNQRVELVISRDQRQLLVAAYPAVDRVLLHMRDVTDARDLEVRRLQAEKLASIGLLAAGVAHEINNPASFVLHNLDSVLSVLQTMDEKLASQPRVARSLGAQALMFDAMSILQESKEGMARITRIVRDLHSFSRVDDDTQVATDANVSLESALSMLRNELRYRATVIRDLRATRHVPGGAARLGQVFLNIILNAAHAMSEGGPERNRLWVRSFDTPSGVVVEIQDSGPGIAADVMSRVFESFYTTKPRGVGTGLGLPISRDIVLSLGGKIEAESEPGRGALFRVTLPFLAAKDQPPSPKVEGRTGRRRRVLAVDDETLLLKAYRRMLIDHHDVEIRGSATEALALLAIDRDFDVILCDLQMPGMSGAEFFAAVRELYPELPQRFLFITGGAFAPEARRFLEESPPACIHKPFALDELLSRIDALAQDQGTRRSPVLRLPELADPSQIRH
ncbi:MAG: ATP-binding protein [Deltaproteobacteria bacterium]|nr:ATP-binding protein [Deltaproteobacteria bacterium]